MSIENMDSAPYSHDDLEAAGQKLVGKILESPVHERYRDLVLRRRLLERVTSNAEGRWNWLLWNREESAQAASDEYDAMTDAEKEVILGDAGSEVLDSYVTTINSLFAMAHALGIDPRGLLQSVDTVTLVAATFRPQLPQVDDERLAA